MSKPTLLILAAGMGSRYGGLKQIDPVGPHGEIIIDYSIYDAIRAGFDKVVFVIRRDIEKEFKEAIGNRFEDRVAVEYVFQELAMLPDGYALPEGRVKPWGTAHAILAAKDVIREPFGVINADDFYGATGYRLLGDYLAADAGPSRCALVAFVLRNTLSDHGSVARGVCTCAADSTLETVTEYLEIEPTDGAAVDRNTDTPFTGDERVSMNMWGFSPDFFQVLESRFSAFLDASLTVPKSEYQIPTVVDEHMREAGARVEVLPTSDTWFGVTYPGDKPRVAESIANLHAAGVYPTPLWSTP